MDILRHGPHVEVISPPSLRSAVADQHREAAEKYALPKRPVASAQSRDISVRDIEAPDAGGRRKRQKH